ncbi:unnamed protein product [Prorocentrum cordatum]|uniref:Uncharacterized protein n=1 Tax=Prorocentrum cordatum TaxID=2364126 RepID=A0ABN9XMI7_9DINO|nr:unnamed protein product [Polarella glacialis]
MAVTEVCATQAGMCDVFGPPMCGSPFQKYQVFKSKQTVYLFGIDRVAKEYSVLRIPRENAGHLELLDGEERFHTRRLQLHQDELQISEGPSGGLEKIAVACGLVGFVRFLQGYYLSLGNQKVGKIGHHYVLSIEETMLVPLFTEKITKAEKSLRDQFDIPLKDFYFSYPG